MSSDDAWHEHLYQRARIGSMLMLAVLLIVLSLEMDAMDAAIAVANDISTKLSACLNSASSLMDSSVLVYEREVS